MQPVFAAVQEYARVFGMAPRRPGSPPPKELTNQGGSLTRPIIRPEKGDRKRFEKLMAEMYTPGTFAPSLATLLDNDESWMSLTTPTGKILSYAKESMPKGSPRNLSKELTQGGPVASTVSRPLAASVEFLDDSHFIKQEQDLTLQALFMIIFMYSIVHTMIMHPDPSVRKGSILLAMSQWEVPLPLLEKAEAYFDERDERNNIDYLKIRTSIDENKPEIARRLAAEIQAFTPTAPAP